MTEKSSKEAFGIWMKLSPEIIGKILSAVWCSQCATAVTMIDYSVGSDKGEIVLRGFCGKCGHKVARVLEGSGGGLKTARKFSLKHYIFDVWLYGDENCTPEKRIIRKIQITGTKSLYSFARVITQAFDFYFDHCFGFYDTLKDRGNCKKGFELFVDIGEEPTRPVVKGVQKIKIAQAFEYIGEKMIFLFDYGDGWQFTVELKEIREAEKGDTISVVLERIGKAPQQYPPCENI